MAKQLKSLPKGLHIKGVYPWKLWMNGEPWQLFHGVDFVISQRSMRTTIYATAKRLGLRVSAHPYQKGLVIQARPRPK